MYKVINSADGVVNYLVGRKCSMTENKTLRETTSLCPVCLKRLKATVIDKDGEIIIEKECAEHGKFNEVYWENAELFDWAERFRRDDIQPSSFQTKTENGCPFDCGLCPSHISHTVIAIIDVNNKCDLKFPICFADASKPQFIYEPTKESVFRMLNFLKSLNPSPPVIQFSGGEPLLHDELVEYVKKAHELKFMIILTTNGLRLFKEPELARKLKDAGANVVYLQFDGVTGKPYEMIRGRDLLSEKKKIVEICRAVDLEVVLVPTLAKGINDTEIGGILKFAAENIDIIRGVIFQPLSFVGRFGNINRKENRITVPEVSTCIEEQTDGEITRKDLCPIPIMVQAQKFMSSFMSKPWPYFTSEPHCGVTTWVLTSKKTGRTFTPINRIWDIDKVLARLEGFSGEIQSGLVGRAKVYAKLAFEVFNFITEKSALEELGLRNTVKTIVKFLIKPSYASLGGIRRRLLLVGCMAFMDNYNFDIERVKKCLIHYVTPDLQIIPFCAYNLLYRENVEKNCQIGQICSG